jgi:hypothetical protein
VKGWENLEETKEDFHGAFLFLFLWIYAVVLPVVLPVFARLVWLPASPSVPLSPSWLPA